MRVGIWKDQSMFVQPQAESGAFRSSVLDSGVNPIHRSFATVILNAQLFSFWLILFLVVAWPQVSLAKGETGVWGVIRTQTATVYSAPNFDGRILASLPNKSRVVMSKSTSGNQGPQFYKVKIKLNGKSVIGYIVDAEIGSEKAGVLVAKAAKPDGTAVQNVAGETAIKGKKDGENFSKVAGAHRRKKKKKREKEKQPMLFSSYAGLVVGLTDFKEKISGVNASENMLTYGIKLTGLDLLLKGPITEFNFMIHSGAPSYYGALSGIKPTGFIIWTDALLVYPFFNRDNSMISFNAGPLLVISDFKVLRNDKLMDLFALNAGFSTALSGAYRIGSVALRVEVKYMFENRSYLALLGSLQSEF